MTGGLHIGKGRFVTQKKKKKMKNEKSEITNI